MTCATSLWRLSPTIGKANGRRLSKFNPDDFDWIAPNPEPTASTSPEWRRVLVRFGVDVPKRNHILSVGYTATPNRSDGTALSNNFDEIVYEYPILRGMADGILVDLHAVRINTDVDLDGVAWTKGQFNDASLTKSTRTGAMALSLVHGWSTAKA